MSSLLLKLLRSSSWAVAMSAVLFSFFFKSSHSQLREQPALYMGINKNPSLKNGLNAEL